MKKASLLNIEKNDLLVSSRDVAEILQKTCGKGNAFKFTATGSSMSPFICDGDSLIINPVGTKKIEIGDVAAVVTPGDNKLIVHRIIDIRGNRYLTKGDNVHRFDGYYDKKCLGGYVKKVILLAKKPHVLGKKYHIFGEKLRKIILVFNHKKKFLALLSRHKILTYLCRIANRAIL